uniref:Family with sequence similarity 186, member B n=1 Tax=Jaculus jaculus TaxID=51337 RepID=A0A8C5L636_JACJA
MEKDNPPHLVIPTSVKTIISRIEAAQLTRTQEDISHQLSDILDNVNCAINRFQEELGYDLKEKAKSHQPEQKGKKRFILLEKIASFSKDAKTKEKHLYEILDWLGDWGDSLTYEIKNRKSEEEEEGMDEWIEVMEKVLPLSLMATKGGIESLISLCSTLIEEQKKKTQMSKHNLWADWLEKSQQKSSPHPQPPSPEHMLQDKPSACTKVSEVKSMLQELLDSTMFNKGEVKAIRYMATVVENLNKALIFQHKENRDLETKYRHLQLEMTKELGSQKQYFQKSIEDLESKRDALLKQVEALGRKYHDLLLIKRALEFQLQAAQTAGGQAEDLGEDFVHSTSTPEKETLPEKEMVVEETQPELKEEQHLFSPLSPRSSAKASDGGATPPARPPRPSLAVHARIADVFSDHTRSLEPVLLPSRAPEFPVHWERLMKEDVQKSCHSKHSSPPGSGKMSLESQVGHWEEELGWERQRQKWLQEEEMWLQRQKKWALQEQEHQEKLRQWEAEAAARQQWQRLTQPEEEERKEDAERLIFTTTSRWRNLEKAEPSPVPPPSRSQSACQSRRPRLPVAPHAQEPCPRALRTANSAEVTQRPPRAAQQVPTKPKKSTSCPITGTTIRRVARPPMHKYPVTPKEKEYRMDTQAQRKNLQLLGGEAELALPHYLRSKALALTTTTIELSICKLQCLCQKYIHYRRFQRLRQEVIRHIRAMRQTRATHKAQSLYLFLENIDHQQRVKLQAWTDKRKHLEMKHRECLRSMVTMFPRLQREWNVHLNIPVTSTKPKKCKSPPALLERVRSGGTTSKGPSASKHPESAPLHQGRKMEAIWKADVASSSHPIERKTPASLPWDQLEGYPDIPRLLAVDEHSYHRNMKSSKTHSFSASTTQMKECQDPSEELAEFVYKKSSHSLPGVLQSKKDRGSFRPHSIP